MEVKNIPWNYARIYLGKLGENIEQWEGYCGELASNVAGEKGSILHVEGEIWDRWRYHQVPVLDGLVHDAWCPGPARPIADWLRFMFGDGWVEVAIDAIDCYEGPADRFALLALPERGVLRRPAWLTGTSDCDWDEDADHENGNYFRVCVVCGSDFIGHKRRYSCRVCHVAAKKVFDEMSPEQREAKMTELAKAVEQFMKRRETGEL